MVNIKKKFFKHGATIFFIIGLIAGLIIYLTQGAEVLIDRVLFAFFLFGVVYYFLSIIGLKK